MMHLLDRQLLFCRLQRLSHLSRRGAAGKVRASENIFEPDRLPKIFSEERTVLPQFSVRQVLDGTAPFETELHHLSNYLVRQPKRQSFVRKIVGRGNRVHMT